MFGRLIFSDDMLNFLSVCSIKKISNILLYGETIFFSEEGNFIKQETSINQNDFISYLPLSKLNAIEKTDPFTKGIGRVKIKVGRFLRKFLNKEAFENFSITDKDIEEFVNQFKSYFNNSTDVIKVVSGQEILSLYLEENYYAPAGKRIGTLWNSCMRYRDRNRFMRIYSQNNNIKMAVYMVDGAVRCRALLWENVSDSSGNSYKIMDRIYSVFDHDVILFKQWAAENGYLSKFYQNAKTENIFDIGGVANKKELTVKLENFHFNSYPYLDTFKYFNSRKGIFSNSAKFGFDYILIQSNGSVEPEPEPEPEWDDEN